MHNNKRSCTCIFKKMKIFIGNIGASDLKFLEIYIIQFNQLFLS